MEIENKLEKEEVLKRWIEYRNSVSENKSKSQDDFEKYINLLASGGIVIALTFIEKILSVSKIEYLFLMAFGIFCLIVTLLSNLCSHYKSIIDSDKTIKEIDEKKFENIFENIEKRNKDINLLNKASILSLIIGFCIIITSITLNINTMNETPTTINQPSGPLTEEKGRTLPPPPVNKPSTDPKK